MFSNDEYDDTHMDIAPNTAAAREESVAGGQLVQAMTVVWCRREP